MKNNIPSARAAKPAPLPDAQYDAGREAQLALTRVVDRLHAAGPRFEQAEKAACIVHMHVSKLLASVATDEQAARARREAA